MLEGVSRMVLQSAGDFATDDKRKIILPSHVMLALRTNEELDELCKWGGVMIPYSRTLPTTEPGPQNKK